MQITIIGVGAMACLFGARLNSLADVTLIGHWPEQISTLQKKGLILEEANGRQTHHHLFVTNKATNLPKADLSLVLVKSHQTDQAAHLAKGIAAESGLVLTLQNGLGNVEALTAVINPNQVGLGITSAGAAIRQPGHIRLAGLGHTYLAELPNKTKQMTQVKHLFQEAGFPTDLTNNPDSLVWGKLAINAGINPLTAILQQPNGFLAQNKRAKRLMMQAATEVTAVAQAKQISLPYKDAALQALHVAQTTASNRSSMLQDMQRGAKTEIEAISGAVIRHGRDQHVPTPTNHILYQFLQEMESNSGTQPTNPEIILDELENRLKKEAFS